jgi:hypothetical protein
LNSVAPKSYVKKGCEKVISNESDK